MEKKKKNINESNLISFIYIYFFLFVFTDTFPVGCMFSPSIVFPEFFKNNPDYTNPKYNTLYGIYEPNCGLDNVLMSYGHDEYLYQVVKVRIIT